MPLPVKDFTKPLESITHQILFKIGRFELHSYGLMMFIAFALGVLLSVHRAKREGIQSQFVMDLTVWLMVGGLAGARIAYVLFHFDEFSGRWLDIISPIQSDGTIGIAGLVVLGGVIAGAGVAYWYTKRNNIPFLKVLDIMIPALVFGIAIGRIGCYLNGCCFGHPTDLPWGVTFPNNCYAGMVFVDEKIHPTQLYATLFNVLIGLFLLASTNYKKFEGELFFWFLTLYGIFRFGNETLRYYRSGMILYSSGDYFFSISMLITTLMTITGLVMLIKGYQKLK
jgi:phosphatidylglycerol---prolipoprotein diacylglyceryl transferase